MNHDLLKAIAFYLPQFHPIKENNEWWGPGFTEWTSVAKARSLYKGHYQPNLPADLGFYDLRLPETRNMQAEIARRYGVGGFCYYHYWFAGRRILERPFNEVLNSGEPNFPFMLCWANETWTGVWHGMPDKVLIEQTYPGDIDYEQHFNELLPAFRDDRYIKIDGKPVFLVWKPMDLPDPKKFVKIWVALAEKAGLEGLYLIGIKHNIQSWSASKINFNAELSIIMPEKSNPPEMPTIYDYSIIYKRFIPNINNQEIIYPCIMPNWDNTPRCGNDGIVFENATPEIFEKQICMAVDYVKKIPVSERLIFIKAWNEWAEGNAMEPSIRYGHGYLDALKRQLLN